MKPNFVLTLSHDGIGLLHRAIDGWHSVGDVRLDDPEFMEKLGFLRKTAAALDKNGITSKLVIPNSQILYTTVQAPGPSEDEKQQQIIAALDGLTPYTIAELAYDYRDAEAGVQVAAVAKETLGEAEDFAAEHGFNPVSFIAIPESDVFAGEPFFGETRGAAKILAGATPLERDLKIIKIVQAPKKAAEIQDSPKPLSPPESPPETPPKIKPDTPKPKDAEIALPAFSSRRDTGSATPPNTTLDKIEQITSRFDLTENGGGANAPKLGGAARLSAAPKPPELSTKTEPRITATTAPETTEPAPEMALKPAPKAPEPAAAPPNKTKRAKSGFKLPFGGKKAPKTAAAAKPDKPATSPPKNNPAPVDEAEALTIFGARKHNSQRGKPRFLGLILMLLLIAALLGIAFWSTYFLDDISNLWRNDDATPQVAQQDTNPPEPITEPNQTENPVSDALARLSTPITQPDPNDQAAASAVEPEQQLPENTDDAKAQTTTQTADTTELALEPEPQIVTGLDPALFTADSQTDPPLAPVTPEQARAVYQDTGIWQLAPPASSPPAADEIRSLYITSIDPKIHSQDAVALPPHQPNSTDTLITSPNPPAAAHVTFVLDDRGMVIPSKEGTVNAEGILVFAGPPPKRPKYRPASQATTTTDDIAVQDQRLAGFRPKYRPNDLAERNERANLGGYTRQQLSKLRPAARPIAPKAEKEADETPTAQAVAASNPPSHRPKQFAALVKRALAQAANDPTQATVGVSSDQSITPRIPTRASVARRATVKNAINLRHVNLIGVYGKPSARRALVRLRNGRYVRVKVGQRVDGGKVAAISETSLRYVKGGRTITLKMPKL